MFVWLHQASTTEDCNAEKEVLAKFCRVYHDQRCFSQLDDAQTFKQVSHCVILLQQ